MKRLFKLWSLAWIALAATSLVFGQSYPFDLANSTTEGYAQVWEEATIEQVRDWLETGIDMEARDAIGMTVLTWAGRSVKDPAIIQALVDAGANPNAQDSLRNLSVLTWTASINPNPEVVRAVVAAGAMDFAIDEGFSALIWSALANKNPEIIRTLLDLGANPNSKDSLGMNVLAWALSSDKAQNLEQIRILLEAGADINSIDSLGFTPLLYSLDRNQNDSLNLLLEAGADVNFAAGQGLTALMKASSFDKLEAVKLLLAAGADVNARLVPYGTTALMMAAANASTLELIEVLLEAGADATSQESDGKTAFDYAAENPLLAKEIQQLLATLPGVVGSSGSSNTFVMGDTKTAEVAEGMAAIIHFDIPANLPSTIYQFKLASSDTLELHFELSGPDGRSLFDKHLFPGESMDYGAKLSTEGHYTLTLTALRGEGSYTLESSYPMGSPEERKDRGDTQGSLFIGQEVSGKVGYNISDIYTFEAIAGVPVAFNISSPNDPDARFMLYSEWADKGFYGLATSEDGQFIFMPENTGSYQIRVSDQPDNRAADYLLSVQGLEGYTQAGPQELTEGQPMEGRLIAAVTHRFIIEASPLSQAGTNTISISATGSSKLSYALFVNGESYPLNEMKGSILPGKTATIRMAGTGSIGPMIGRKTFSLEEGMFELRLWGDSGPAPYSVVLERIP